MRRLIALSGLMLLSACASAPAPTRPAFPEGLKVMGEGFPCLGGPCARLGETLATRELRDASADWLGCPAAAMTDPKVAGVGRVVGQFEGVVLVSVPKSAGQ